MINMSPQISIAEEDNVSERKMTHTVADRKIESAIIRVNVQD